MKPGFVLDASVALSWFFKDEMSVQAEAVRESLLSVSAIVPVIFPLEVVNALVVAERRGRCTIEQSKEWLGLLGALPIEMFTTLPRFSEMETARKTGLAVYDAQYVELARVNRLPLATLDVRMKGACRVVGVKEYLGAEGSL